MTVYLERGYNRKEYQWFYKQYQNIYSKEIFMIYVGIDIAKDKHDCFITNSDGEVLFKSFTISNNRDGFETLFQKIQSVSDDLTKVKVGLEATGHYSYNLLGYLLDKGLPTYVINPLHTNPCDCNLVLNKPSCGI